MSITPYVPPSALTSLPNAIWSGVGGLPVFPYLPGQSPVVSKSPMWSSLVKRASSGRERTLQMWPYPLWQFMVKYSVVRKLGGPFSRAVDELSTLFEFFNVQQGMTQPWLMVDPSDCQVLVGAPAPLINTVSGLSTGDGATRTFQLNRSINSFNEPVYAVYAPTLLDNGGAAGANSVSGSVVTFSVAPTAGHTMSWYGYFYFGCRFLQDELTMDQIVQLLWSNNGLKFTSKRV